jgi:hypothetical protein
VQVAAILSAISGNHLPKSLRARISRVLSAMWLSKWDPSQAHEGVEIMAFREVERLSGEDRRVVPGDEIVMLHPRPRLGSSLGPNPSLEGKPAREPLQNHHAVPLRGLSPRPPGLGLSDRRSEDGGGRLWSWASPRPNLGPTRGRGSPSAL